MTKTDTNIDHLAEHKTFNGLETLPDIKGEKVSHTKVWKIRNNKPRSDK
jgi:hypothetical protein